jgi:hypothetical protein
MNLPVEHSIGSRGLDASFEAEDAHKSNLILEAHYLRVHGEFDEAAVKAAQAAEIEERLGAICEANGLLEKSWVHQFSAACCWEQAGNYYAAIRLSSELLARPDLPERLRQRVQKYNQSLRQLRSQWLATMIPAAVNE